MFRTLCFLALIFVAVKSDTGGPKQQAEIQPKTPKLQQSVSFRKLNCISCTNCDKTSRSLIFKECPRYNYLKTQKCVTYLVKYPDMEKPWSIRGCSSERGDCEEIRRVSADTGATVKSCHECEGDKCNGANGSHSPIAAILVLIVAPILSKIALS